MRPKAKKPSPRAGGKRKRDLRHRTRQSESESSSSQYPSKRGKDADCASAPATDVEMDNDLGATLVRRDPGGVHDALSSKSTTEATANGKPGIHTTLAASPALLVDKFRSPSGGSLSEGPTGITGVLSRPGVKHVGAGTTKAEDEKPQKPVPRPARALVLHIPAPVTIDDLEDRLVVTSSPSPGKYTRTRSPSKSPRKPHFGVGLGGGITGDISFPMDSPGKRYDERMGQAIASSPTLGSMGPPSSTPGASVGSGSPFDFGTAGSQFMDGYESPTPSPKRRIRNQSLLSMTDSPTTASYRDFERAHLSGSLFEDGQPRSSLGTLYEKPRFPGSGSMFGASSSTRQASPERGSLADGIDTRPDVNSPVPMSIDDFLKSCERASPGKMPGLSAFDLLVGDGSPKLRSSRALPLERYSPEIEDYPSDYESDPEEADKENAGKQVGSTLQG